VKWPKEKNDSKKRRCFYLRPFLDIMGRDDLGRKQMGQVFQAIKAARGLPSAPTIASRNLASQIILQRNGVAGENIGGE